MICPSLHFYRQSDQLNSVKYLDRLNDLTDYTEVARLQSSVAGLRT